MESLLVRPPGSRQYTEIYQLHTYPGTFKAFGSAKLYGMGASVVLGTDDSTTGNNCSDGYWWFDRTGAHPVSFSPLNKAIRQAVPAGSLYEMHCWAFHPAELRTDSFVQTSNALCRVCDILGKVSALYRIEQGQARPVNIVFTPKTHE